MSKGSIQHSVSTWRQPAPEGASNARRQVLDRIVEMIDALGDRRLRIAVDGRTAAGKTSLGHELARGLVARGLVARGLVARGRPVARASLDDFKRPWREASAYDRTSGKGYYRNAFDRDAIRRLLLDPAAPDADGRLALCSIDPLTQVDHSAVQIELPPGGVLIVDGVFACHPALDPSWDLRIWVEIDPELSVRRGIERDTAMEGGAEAAERLHRDRYLASEAIYLDEVDPRSFVEVIVDNTDLDEPFLVRPAPSD